jgi:sigma-70-like protein
MISTTAIDHLMQLGRRRSGLHIDDIRQVLPVDTMTIEELADVVARLEEAGIEIDAVKSASPQWVNLVAETLKLSEKARVALHRAAAKDQGYEIDLGVYPREPPMDKNDARHAGLIDHRSTPHPLDHRAGNPRQKRRQKNPVWCHRGPLVNRFASWTECQSTFLLAGKLSLA